VSNGPIAPNPVDRPLRLAYLADPNSVHTRRWLGFFADRGHDVHLLVGAGDVVAPGLANAIEIHPYRRFGRRRLPLVSSIQGRGELRALLTALAPDVLHAHFVNRYGWQARLSGFHPYAVTPWGSDLLVTPRRSRRARWWGRATLRSADLVTVAGEHLAAAARDLGAHPDRIRLIQFGVDTDRFRPHVPDAAIRARLGLGGRRVLFSPRALTPIYQHETVLRGVAAMPSDVVLLSGARHADPAYARSLRALADELGIGDRFVVMPEFAEADVPDLFALADVVVSVPASDGIPVTVLEAMASGTPVIASDLPGPRACLAGHEDLLVPVADPMALAAALMRVLAMGLPEREALGSRLRATVVDRYEFRTNMLAMEQAYRELAARAVGDR